MQAGPTFDNLLAQPGPSEAPAPQSAAGGVVLNDHAKQAALQSPFHQARVRTLQSLEGLKTLAQQLAQEARGGL